MKTSQSFGVHFTIRKGREKDGKTAVYASITINKDKVHPCGIKKNLTSHVARHTFATTVTLSNGVPIETVSKMLGHTKNCDYTDLCTGT